MKKFVFNDLVGQQFTRWLVVELVGRKKMSQCSRYLWRCRCDCGVEKIIDGGNLLNGQSKSCGCWKRELTIKRSTKHGLWKVPEYQIWHHMKARCERPSWPHYDRYGGRGIKVCARWQVFKNFLDDMGTRPCPLDTIERVNNDDDYSPDNCIWASRKVQGNNRISNHLVTWDGLTKTITQWAEILAISPTALSHRLKKWPIEKAFMHKKSQPKNSSSVKLRL